jgi:hypothetical protein
LLASENSAEPLAYLHTRHGNTRWFRNPNELLRNFAPNDFLRWS